MKTATLAGSIPALALLAASSTWAGEPTASADAHARAAALLSRSSTDDTVVTRGAVQLQSWVAEDGQARAAALLRRPHPDRSTEGGERLISVSSELAPDGHTRAAALLSRPRTI